MELNEEELESRAEDLRLDMMIEQIYFLDEEQRAVVYDKNWYNLTPLQVKALKKLQRNFYESHPWGKKHTSHEDLIYLLWGNDIRSRPRLLDVFRNCPLWGTLIQSPRRGFYTLTLPNGYSGMDRGGLARKVIRKRKRTKLKTKRP